MVQYEGNFSSLVDLDPVLEEIYYQQYAQVPSILLPTIYARRASSKAKETNQRIGSFGDPQLWGGQVHYAKADKGYEVEYVHDHLTLGFKVTQEMFEDNQYSDIFDDAANLGQSFARKIVKDEAATFENAFSSSYLGYDSKALCANDHPLSATDSTAVDNYLGTKALTETNLEAAILQLEGLGDSEGETTNAMATVLLCGRNNRKKAKELIESELSPEDANTAINAYKGELVRVVHPFITGNKWFVIDGAMARMKLKWFWRIQPTFGVDQDVSNTLMRSFFGRMRYSRGWSDFRFVVGSNPS